MYDLSIAKRLITTHSVIETLNTGWDAGLHRWLVVENLFLYLRPGKLDCFSSLPASLFYSTASNFITAVINHVYTYFDAKKAGYPFTAQQISLAPQKW